MKIITLWSLLLLSCSLPFSLGSPVEEIALAGIDHTLETSVGYSANSFVSSALKTVSSLILRGKPQPDTSAYLSKKFTEIIQQLNVFEIKLETMISDLKTHVSLMKLREFRNNLKVESNSFYAIVKSNHNQTNLEKHLNSFIEKHRREQIAYSFIHFIDNDNPGSLVATLIERIEKTSNENFNSYVSSSNRMVFEFYLSAHVLAIQSNMLLKLAYAMKSQITKENPVELYNYCDNMNTALTKMMINLIERTSARLSKIESLRNYRNLMTSSNAKELKFQNVVQTFFEKEEELSGTDSCAKTCPELSGNTFNRLGCYGSVHSCKETATSRVTTYFSALTDRIYSGYELKYYFSSNQRFGSVYGSSEKDLVQHKRWFVDCDVCKCVCDQTGKSNTHRKLYTGLIRAERTDYVITGVRFEKFNSTIYLRIQIGRLLPLGFVDASTVYWQSPPADIQSNTTAFGYFYLDLALGDVKFEDAVLTGVQLTRSNIKIYGRQIIDHSTAKLGNEKVAESPAVTSSYDASGDTPGLGYGSSYYVSYNTRIFFGTSNEINDAGQSFVPYFDPSDIVLNSTSALSGVGLLHYKTSNAGYIRPFVNTYNLKNFIIHL